MSEGKKVKLGVIGCGGIMRFHMMNLAKVPEAEIVGLVETSEANLKRFKEASPALAEAPTFTDYRELLDKVQLDGVLIGTPHTLHFEQIMASLDKGLHVLCEKPMVCAVDHAKQVLAKAEEKKRVVMIAYQRHFSAAYRGSREMIQNDELGKTIFISAMQAQDWLRAVKGTWRQDPALSGGGQLNDSGSHLVDIILWMTGLVPEEVFAFGDNRGSQVDILSAISVKFQGGAMANISIVGDSPLWREDMSIWGEKGAIYIRSSVPQGGFVFQPFGAKAEDLSARFMDSGSADANFVNSILGKEEPQTPALCGLRVIQLTEAVWESAKSGKPAVVKQ